jgi:hypothetical protein
MEDFAIAVTSIALSLVLVDIFFDWFMGKTDGDE